MELKVLATGSKGNCYILTAYNHEKLIIECGIGIKKILEGLEFNLSGVCGCVVTHEHKDHSKSIKDIAKRGIEVFATSGTFECSNIKDMHNKTCIRPLEQFKVGGFTILPFDTEHDCKEPVGFLIHHEEMGNLLFATDTYYIKYKFPGLNHIMIECNYDSDILDENVAENRIHGFLRNRIIRSHFELGNVKNFLESNDLKEVNEIVLIHLSGDNSDPERFKEEIMKCSGCPAYVAGPGLEINFDLS